MIAFTKYRLVMSVVSIVLIFALTFVSLFAYFKTQENRGIEISTGEFEVEMLVSFNNVVVDLESPYYDHEKHKIVINAYDNQAINYIGNLKIELKVKPIVAARVRFKIKQETELTRHYIDQNPQNPTPPLKEAVYHSDQGFPYYPFSLLKFDPLFTVIVDDEGYIYYDQIIKKNSEIMISIIDGGNPYTVRMNSVLYEECYIYLDMDLDIVQANRFSEVWDIADTFFD